MIHGNNRSSPSSPNVLPNEWYPDNGALSILLILILEELQQIKLLHFNPRFEKGIRRKGISHSAHRIAHHDLSANRPVKIPKIAGVAEGGVNAVCYQNVVRPLLSGDQMSKVGTGSELSQRPHALSTDHHQHSEEVRPSKQLPRGEHQALDKVLDAAGNERSVELGTVVEHDKRRHRQRVRVEQRVPNVLQRVEHRGDDHVEDKGKETRLAE